MEVAKNFLHGDEAERMCRLTGMFLDYAEDQASMGKTILLNEWMAKTDAWLQFNDREVLEGFGKRSRKQAMDKVRHEWDLYQERLDREVNEIDMRQLEHEITQLKKGKDQID